jgi:type IV pilus assembly protein PilM
MAKTFGLDIGSDSIKVLQAERAKEGFRLVHFASLSCAGEDQAEVIKQVVKEAGIKGGEVNVALPESDVYTRIVQTPRLSQAELASAIQYEAEQYVPVSLEEVELYHQVLMPVELAAEQKTMDVLLIAVKKERLKRLTDLLDKAGLMPRSLETELFALKRIFAKPDKPQLLVSFGHRTTDLMALDKGLPLIIHSFPTGGLALTKTLTNELSLSLEEAEQYKRSYGLRDDVLEGKIAKLLTPLIKELVNQIKKAYVFIQQKGKHHLPEELIITGGGALLPGLSVFLAEQLNVEVLVGDPLVGFIKDDEFKKKIGSETNPQLATVTGLALKDLI